MTNGPGKVKWEIVNHGNMSFMSFIKNVKISLPIQVKRRYIQDLLHAPFLLLLLLKNLVLGIYYELTGCTPGCFNSGSGLKEL